jgi:hypothetical protein
LTHNDRTKRHGPQAVRAFGPTRRPGLAPRLSITSSARLLDPWGAKVTHWHRPLISGTICCGQASSLRLHAPPRRLPLTAHNPALAQLRQYRSDARQERRRDVRCFGSDRQSSAIRPARSVDVMGSRASRTAVNIPRQSRGLYDVSRSKRLKTPLAWLLTSEGPAVASGNTRAFVTS